MQRAIQKLWYSQSNWRWLLWPFARVYQSIVGIRRVILEKYYQQHFPVPVIIVGNITVGGVGKTPLVIALVQALQRKGIRVGVVSRGYGSRVAHYPYLVKKEDDARKTGDEPLLIVQKTGCDLVIAPKRAVAVQYLLDNCQSQIIISDDGLQHYAMGRAIEIAVIDGQRGLGNQLCLPAGPLREHKARLRQVDFVVVNSGNWPDAYAMQLKPGPITQLKTGYTVNTDSLGGSIAAVAAIGHPQRFYATLNTLGVNFKPYSFADHHAFCPDDLAVAEQTVIMTEKDAVKCHSFAKSSWYCLPVEAELEPAFWQALWSHEQLKGLV
ncbi:tetraacyldisaccharide 4'-kinase [Legionella dresdenensis]|uniref:Tetraacyldisaccharide 4'-kinase n=1 Tax=Legionella dresdenensis TaxID=450200 RepID=A0ABV8CF77_9GAMM